MRKGEHVEEPRSWRLQGLFGEQKVPQLAGLELGFKPQAILLFPLSPSAFHRDPGFRAITFLKMDVCSPTDKEPVTFV